jgi:RHS repeat-associated protein
MFEERTVGTDDSAEHLARFSYSNHLGSASLELDYSAAIISYEEYHPYGTTSYQAVNASINAVAKRYRYTGKERDEESGLYYHGARYYACWLARWTAVDPLEGKYAGWSAYQYCTCNPIVNTDSTGTENDRRTITEKDLNLPKAFQQPKGKVQPLEMPPPPPDPDPPVSNDSSTASSQDIKPPVGLTDDWGEIGKIFDVIDSAVKEIEETWEAYKIADPIHAGQMAGTFNFAINTLKGIGNMLMHPMDTAKGLSTLSKYTSFEGIISDPDGALNFYKNVFNQVEKSIQEFKNADDYEKSAKATELGLTVLSFFVGPGEAKAVGAAEEITNAAKATELVDNSNLVFRVIRPDEDIVAGIIAKNPNFTRGKGLIEDLTYHIRYAKNKNVKTQFISMTGDWAVAERHAIESGNRIIGIDLNKVEGQLFDLRNPTVRNTMITNPVARNFAKASDELLLIGRIPSHAITPLRGF